MLKRRPILYPRIPGHHGASREQSREHRGFRSRPGRGRLRAPRATTDAIGAVVRSNRTTTTSRAARSRGCPRRRCPHPAWLPRPPRLCVRCREVFALVQARRGIGAPCCTHKPARGSQRPEVLPCACNIPVRWPPPAAGCRAWRPAAARCAAGPSPGRSRARTSPIWIEEVPVWTADR
jgi:hypothetical protein